MYAKCGSLEDVQKVFDNMPSKNVVTWPAMVAGYAQYGLGQKALTTYASMQQEGSVPANAATFLCLLQACGSVPGLEKGKEIHDQITKSGLEATDPSMANALIDMYCKCGSMADALNIFNALAELDVVAWSALISRYARQGESELVFDLFQGMRKEGIQPNGITFVGISNVCSHVGLVEKGQKYFEMMRRDYGITRTIEHHTCMIDLLGRAGHLDKAMEVVNGMPFQPDYVVWMSILGACQQWRNVELGRRTFECSVKLDENDDAAHVIMSNIYADAQMQEDANGIQAMRANIRACKGPGRSWWADVGGVVHAFVVADREHPEWHHLDSKLEDICFKMKKEGRGAHLEPVLQEVGEDKNALALCGNSAELYITQPEVLVLSHAQKLPKRRSLMQGNFHDQQPLAVHAEHGSNPSVAMTSPGAGSRPGGWTQVVCVVGGCQMGILLLLLLFLAECGSLGCTVVRDSDKEVACNLPDACAVQCCTVDKRMG